MANFVLTDDQLYDLIEDRLYLQSLADAGVDNWAGCYEAEPVKQDEIFDAMSLFDELEEYL